MAKGRAKAQDVAEYICGFSTDKPSAKKLQKLLYYSQAWSLVWDGEPLFSEPIKAWAEGPVCGTVWFERKSNPGVPLGDPSALSPSQCETVNAVLSFYGSKDGDWLGELTHREDPWLHARQGIPMDHKSKEEITRASMREYYERAHLSKGEFTEAFERGLEWLMAEPPGGYRNDRLVDATDHFGFSETE